MKRDERPLGTFETKSPWIHANGLPVWTGTDSVTITVKV